MTEGASAHIDAYLDELTPETVRGWAWKPSAPETVLIVEIVDAHGLVVSYAPADLFRGDLESAAKRDGRCAFDLSIPRDGSPIYVVRVSDPDHGDTRVLGEVDAAGVEPDGWRQIAAGEVVGWVDRADAVEVSGWCHGPEPFAEPVALDLVADGVVVASTRADRWRNDLQEVRQGDCRCGFRFDLPEALYDGRQRRLELRLSDGVEASAGAVRVAFPAEAPARHQSTPPPRPAEDTPIAFSIVVNFYNMEREAARTLRSLTREFQNEVGDLAYEVLCVDNGSNPPLEAAFIESFGPEFRLIRPSVLHPSPCGAINEAAAQARGRWIAVMIDGAHILSPGVLQEAHTAFRCRPSAVVALRQWFIGGDQRWFAVAGYTRAQEDVLFSRIDWPNDGYALFEISSPIYESPNGWLDGLSESNCLFMPADLWRRIGGFDTAFDIPGAGFANLDLLRRAAETAGQVVSLIGEASFHQFHGGVTTNAEDAEKDAKVRTYAMQYEQLRGRPFVNIDPSRISLSGSIKTDLALTGRQRTYCPAQIGVTDRVRPRPENIQYDEGTQQYLQGAYVETGRHLETRWRGMPVGLAPTDLLDIQEALWRVRPDRVVLRGAGAGLAAYVHSLLPVLGLDETRMLAIGGETPLPGLGIEAFMSGPEGFERLEEAIADAETVLVLFQPGADDAFPVAELERYAGLVSFGSYLVVLKTAFGQPWLGYSRAWTHGALRRLLHSRRDFVIDRTLARHLVTTSPDGFLRRVLDPLPFRSYDATLDDLGGL